MTFAEGLEAMPLIAILRGLKPSEAEAVGGALAEAGIRAAEVPLNSPEPFRSIAVMARALGKDMAIGAGTLVEPADAARVAEAGGVFAVSPHTDERVISASLMYGLVPLPGFATASEAFAAIRAGAEHLKLFPAGTYGPGHLKALKAVLPQGVAVYAVGGISDETMASWAAAGADGFGLGSSLYRPGDAAATVKSRARKAIQAMRSLMPDTKTETSGEGPTHGAFKS